MDIFHASLMKLESIKLDAVPTIEQMLEHAYLMGKYEKDN